MISCWIHWIDNEWPSVHTAGNFARLHIFISGKSYECQQNVFVWIFVTSIQILVTLNPKLSSNHCHQLQRDIKYMKVLPFTAPVCESWFQNCYSLHKWQFLEFCAIFHPTGTGTFSRRSEIPNMVTRMNSNNVEAPKNNLAWHKTKYRVTNKINLIGKPCFHISERKVGLPHMCPEVKNKSRSYLKTWEFGYVKTATTEIVFEYLIHTNK